MGAAGTLWVYRHTVGVERPNPVFDPDDPASGPPTVWVEPPVMDVFDLEGRYLGPVKLPEELGRFLPRATLRSTTEEVWAPRLHDLGYPQVVRYGFEPQGGPE